MSDGVVYEAFCRHSDSGHTGTAARRAGCYPYNYPPISETKIVIITETPLVPILTETPTEFPTPSPTPLIPTLSPSPIFGEGSETSTETPTPSLTPDFSTQTPFLIPSPSPTPGEGSATPDAGLIPFDLTIAALPFSAPVPADAVVELRVFFGNGALEMTLRDSGAGGYRVLVREDNQIGIFRDGELIQVISTSNLMGMVHLVRFSAIGNTFAFTLNGVKLFSYTDPTPLAGNTLRVDTTGSIGAIVEVIGAWTVSASNVTATPTATASETAPATATVLATATYSPYIEPELPQRRGFGPTCATLAIIQEGDTAALRNMLNNCVNVSPTTLFTIYVRQNVNYLPFSIDEPLTINGQVVIYANNTAFVSTRSSGKPIFIIAGVYAAVELHHVNLQNARNTAIGYGGGIDNSGQLTIYDSAFYNNQAVNGGGAINNIGTLAVYRTDFVGNSAGGGGAIQNSYDGVATIECSRFESNGGDYGGALLIGNNATPGNSITVRQSAFERNRAYHPQFGDDIYSFSADFTIQAPENWWGIDGIPGVSEYVTVTDSLTTDPTTPVNEIYTFPECAPVASPPIPANIPQPPTSGDDLNIFQDLPAPPDELLQQARDAIALLDADSPDVLLSGEPCPVVVSGDDESVRLEKRSVCIQYAYASFYAFFERFSGEPPKIWHLLAAIQEGELGYFYQTENAAEALTRNFASQDVSCLYTTTTSCSYEQLNIWLTQMYWKDSVTYNGSTNVVEINEIIDSGLRWGDAYDLLIIQQGESIEDTLDRKGMFSLDGWLKETIQANWYSNQWFTGQGPNVPSTWGNKNIQAKSTTYQPLPNEFNYVILHNTPDRQTVGFVDSPNTDGATDATCTQVAVIVSTNGRFNASQIACPRS